MARNLDLCADLRARSGIRLRSGLSAIDRRVLLRLSDSVGSINLVRSPSSADELREEPNGS